MLTVGTDFLYLGYFDDKWFWDCAAKTVNTINVENYNSLVMETEKYIHGESWQGNALTYGLISTDNNTVIVGYKLGSTEVNEKSTNIFDLSSYQNEIGYCYIRNYCGHTAHPYEGYDRNSYIYLYQAYLEK